MRRVRLNLSALFGSTGRPAISAVTSWGCAALAYPLATKGGYAGAIAAALVLSLSVLLLACLLGSGALAFIADARRSCLPGAQRLARHANLLASLLLLPSLMLTVAALAGNPVWPAWFPTVLVLAIALAGVLAPRRPAAAGGLLLLVVLAACRAATGCRVHEQGKEWVLTLLAAVLVLFVAAFPLSIAVEWRRVIRWGSRAPSLTPDPTPRTPASRYGSWERQPPVQIVRTCLGGMFVEPSRQLIISAAVIALFIGTAIGLPWLGADGLRRAVTLLAIATAGLMLNGFLNRLPNLTRGQLAELALMPGLGTPAAQRRALCRAVLAPPLLWLGVLLLFGCAALLLKGEPLSSLGTLAVCLFIMWLSYAVLTLQKLATFRPKRPSFMSEFLLIYLLIYISGNYYWVFAAHPEFRPWFWFWVTPALLGVGIAGAIAFSLRRLVTAPHPFLSSDSANSRMNM